MGYIMISKQKFRKNNTKKNRKKKTKGGEVEEHVINNVKDALNVDNLGDLTLDDFKKRMDSKGYIQSTWHGLTNDFESYKNASNDEKDNMLNKLASHFKYAEDSYYEDIEGDDSTIGKILARGYNQTKLLYNRATKNQCTAAAKEAWIQARMKYGSSNLSKKSMGELYYKYHPNCCNEDFDNKNVCSDEEKEIGRKFRTIKSVATSIPRGLYNATVADGVNTFDEALHLKNLKSGDEDRKKK